MRTGAGRSDWRRPAKEVTHLWTVDEDVVVPPDAHRLLDVDADIVAARVPVWLGRKDQDGGPRYGLTVPAGAVVQKEGHG